MFFLILYYRHIIDQLRGLVLIFVFRVVLKNYSLLSEMILASEGRIRIDNEVIVY